MSNKKTKSKQKAYKVLLVGDTSVGKTSIILQYTKHIHPKVYLSTIGLDFATKEQKLENGEDVTLRIYDTAGQEKFNSIVKNLFKSCQGLILVYDITSIQSFHNINNWLNYVKDNSNKEVKLLLVGNKSDLEDKREVEIIEANNLAKEFDIELIEISAKDNIGVDDVFIKIAKMLYYGINDTEVNDSLNINNDEIIRNNPSSSCCYIF